MNKLLPQAKLYIGKGMSVFPLIANRKTPQIKWEEFQSRRPTAAELQQWFSGGNRNLAIVTGAISGIVVVDYDTEEAWEFAQRMGFPETPTVKTADGYHCYFKHPGGEVRNFQKRKELPGIDLRGDGGYVVAPPSIHPGGSLYEWVGGHSLDDLPLANLPGIFLRAKLPSVPAGIEDGPIPEGSRNSSLTRIAGSLFRKGFDAKDVISRCREVNTIRCNPPLDDEEVRRIVESISKAEDKKRLPESIVAFIRPADEGMLAFVERIKVSSATPSGLKTGWAMFDNDGMDGLQKGLIVIMGQTSSGKSTFAHQGCEQVARLNQDTQVIYFTFEDTAERFYRRSICRAGQLYQNQVRRPRGGYAESMLKEIEKRALAYVKRYSNFHIIDGTQRINGKVQVVTASMMGNIAEEIMNQAGAKRCLVCVDYIQRTPGISGGDLRIKTREFSSELYGLVHRLDSPVIAISSVGRGKNGFLGREDAKESGEIETDADMVISINRPEAIIAAEKALQDDRHREIARVKGIFSGDAGVDCKLRILQILKDRQSGQDDERRIYPFLFQNCYATFKPLAEGLRDLGQIKSSHDIERLLTAHIQPKKKKDLTLDQ